MMRLELYLDKSNRPVIDVYTNHNDEIESARVRNSKVLNLIDKISSQSILDAKSNENDIALKYKEFIVNIREYKKVFELIELQELRGKTLKYFTKKNLKKVKQKHVKRVNKHTGSKIIATALVISLIATAATATHQKKEKNNYSVSHNNYNSYNYVNENSDDLEQIITIESTEKNDIATNNNGDEGVTEVISLNYEDKSNTDKAQTTFSFYGDAIKKYSKMYGLDPELMIAIATQERGIHGEKMDAGGATGLMQIQNSVWRNQKLTAYNYEIGSYETITVEESKLSDLFYNIKVGCMIFQQSLNYMNYNVVAAVQCYNMGYGNMKKILTAYSNKTGKSISQILNNPTNNEWLKYRSLINQGDKKYVEHVLSWMQQDSDINILNHEEEINISVTNSSKLK